jgi:hypothetical protein
VETGFAAPVLAGHRCKAGAACSRARGAREALHEAQKAMTSEQQPGTPITGTLASPSAVRHLWRRKG